MYKEGRQDSKSSNDNQKKKALIIAISDYDNLSSSKQLPFCKNDGQELYRVLKKQGYEIPDHHKLLGRTDSNTMREVIRDFFREDVNPKDMLLFYFSGHGYFDDPDHYLVTSDMDFNKPETKGYWFKELTKLMNRSPSQQIISILDCCYSGGLEIGDKGVENNESKAAEESQFAMSKLINQEVRHAEGICILASSLGLQQSFKMPEHDYSAYSYFLIEGLKGGKGKTVNYSGYVTPELLSVYINNELFDLPHPSRQTPIRKFEFVGEMLLAYYPELASKSTSEYTNEKRRTDYSNLNLRGADLSYHDLSDANFSNSDISAVIFSGARLNRANFEKANNRGSNFKLNDFRLAKFINADLGGFDNLLFVIKSM